MFLSGTKTEKIKKFLKKKKSNYIYKTNIFVKALQTYFLIIY